MPDRKDPLLCKLPPQNIEAEEALIASILIDNSTLDDIVEILSPQDFYRSAHTLIFEAIIELFKNNEPVDLVTLTNRLKLKGNLEKAGGASYLAGVMDSAPLATNARHYAGIVHDKATLRCLIEQGNAIINICLEDSRDVEEIIDLAESGIFKISQKKIRPTFYKVKDLIYGSFKAIESRQNNKTSLSGVPSGFKYLDDITFGFQNSDLIILAARPSMGKTAFALNIARNAAVDYDIPVAIFSLEMSKEQLVMRLLTAEARVNAERLKGGFTSKQDWDQLNNAGSILSNAPIYIDDATDTTALKLRTKARKLKMDKGLGLIIVDYLQLMQISRPSDRRDLDISEISRSLKGLAKELNIPVVALSQLNRQLEKRDDKRPRLADLRESGALEQDADVVAFIHRAEVFKKKGVAIADEGKAEIIVAKQRNGPTDTIRLAFVKQYTRFENLALEMSIQD
jgi:replicative DNA helicase